MKGAAAVLEKEIAKLGDEIEELDQEAAKAKEIREGEQGSYEEANLDYQATIKAIADAIDLLEKSKAKTEVELAQQKVRAVLPLLEKEAEVEQRVQLAAFLQAQIQEDPKARPDLKAEGDYE